jgi:hypothetical protein
MNANDFSPTERAANFPEADLAECTPAKRIGESESELFLVRIRACP